MSAFVDMLSQNATKHLECLSISMALVVRCSLAPSRPNSVRSPLLLAANFSTKANNFEKPDFKGILHSGIVKILKHASEVRSLHASHETNEKLSTSDSLSKFSDTWMNTLEGTHVSQLFVVPFIQANALMLIMPLEATAETCEASSTVFSMPILLTVAIIGATVGGLLARQRKGELQRLNDQLRQINAALRRQAKIESYAPSLSYAPVGSRIPEDEVIVDSRKHDLISRLKSGKNFLRNQDPGKAFVEFKSALELAQNLKDPVEEKKAARGLGASLQRLGKYKDAINYHSMVISVSERTGEDSGNTEAYGAIADCYTELGDLEKAAKFYDKYIATLESD